MAEFLETLKKKAVVGLVGGSDLCKIAEQMAGTIDEGKSMCVGQVGVLCKISIMHTAIQKCMIKFTLLKYNHRN